MADLPIWSDNERIDSEAVLSSVWAWIRSYPVTCLSLLGYLFAIVHWTSWWTRAGLTMQDEKLQWREPSEMRRREPMDALCVVPSLFGISSGWHRRLFSWTSSISRSSKLRYGQYETAMVVPISRHGCSWQGPTIWRTVCIEGNEEEELPAIADM